ncbi:E3 ubiquitin-protein ligase TRIM35-like [Corythoichthys intestinalis]|uniref:E3 ubiquitin-protein ligase TRIM35-like n=1 Tax=Corythoichthys intestinalis TaxID=161448 RepID=UPI0025A62CBF|nr:E3 ubiquitin-protein ligase TRIM35-like [Corythoichthys intestinalis]XP_057679671.1 E3 ubiquitin-protein ligase TRIM35-like [Corythoichthys intestinalis]XP_057679672.1 E3 ubiquitin-protein ligase TRIM35-like [Corythoichthys intestinalis]
MAERAEEDICILHNEKLTLFCVDHHESVCLICKKSEVHAGHKFRPLDKVAQGDRKIIQDSLQLARKRLENSIEVRDNCIEQAAYIKVQRERIDSKIKKDFEELQHFLLVDQEAKLSAVREEEHMKSKMIREKIEAVSRDIAALSHVIKSTEDQLMSHHASFVKNFQTTMTTIRELPIRSERLRGVLLDEVKHVGNLKFTVWERMKEIAPYSPVILDPNTARPELGLFEDLTGVSLTEGQQRPKNPERFKWSTVLGSALTMGTHVWDVELGGNTHWVLGVIWGDTCLQESTHTLLIGCCDDKYLIFDGPYGSWNPPVKLQRIQIRVDTNKRSVSFSESLTNTELGTKQNPSNWPDLAGNAKAYPYFYTTDKIPLKIVQLLPCVTA